MKTSHPPTAFDDRGRGAGLWRERLGFIQRDGQTHALDYLFLNLVFAGRWRNMVITGMNEAVQLIGFGCYYKGSCGFDATPVPKPATTVLMLVSICAVGWSARARWQRGPVDTRVAALQGLQRSIG